MISVNIFNNSNSNSLFLIYLFIFLAQVKSEKEKRPHSSWKYQLGPKEQKEFYRKQIFEAFILNFVRKFCEKK